MMGLGGDILKNEIENSAAGEGHDKRGNNHMSLKEEVPCQRRNRSKKTDEEEGREGVP